MEVNLEQAGRRTGNRNMSTTVRKTASRRGEEYLVMNSGVEVEIEAIFVILFCEKSAEKCQMLETGMGIQELVC